MTGTDAPMPYITMNGRRVAGATPAPVYQVPGRAPPFLGHRIALAPIRHPRYSTTGPESGHAALPHRSTP